MSLRWLSWFLLCISLLSLPLMAQEAHEHGAHIGRVGHVNFPVSCSPKAQETFSRSVAMLHSFWYEEAAKSFTSVAEQDPTCAMAWWGVAMSYYHPLWEPPTKEAMERGVAALEKSKVLDAKTDRERGYIAAVAAFYSTSLGLDYINRNRAYSQAMEKVYLANPTDPEAAIFYSLSLDASALPTDKTYANQRKAGAILEKIFAVQPDHPGVAHYIIHCYDNPVLAPAGLEAARRYAQIAPAVPHALHMPSHIFVRLGLWEDAVHSNLASMQAGKKYEQDTHMGAAWDQRLHPTDYLEYSLLQIGRDSEAAALVEEVSKIQKIQPNNLTADYVLAVVPARYMMERRRWADASALVQRSSPFPYTAAVTYWAKSIGSAHTGDASASSKSVDKIEYLENQLKQSKDQYWAEQVEVLRLEAVSWLTHIQAESIDAQARALSLMRSAADLEDSMEKHPITPGAVLPARELLGDLLLEQGQPAMALVAYETSLKSSPNRFNSLFGAAEAAERSGNASRAREYYARVVENSTSSDSKRSELAQAKAYLAKR